MSKLIKQWSLSNDKNAALNVKQPRKVTCNYNDNYYGDQVCVEVKHEKPRVNFHLGIQI